MEERLRVGIIGLGRRWPRYRRALLSLRPPLEVRALCDPQSSRADDEARRLGCAVAEGPTDLLERDDLDALLLLGPAWWRLWPLERALRAGKPIFCASSLANDEPHADNIRALAQAGNRPVLMAPSPELALLVDQLRVLLDGPLGAARLVRIDWPARLDGPKALPLLRACGTLFGGAPLALRAVGADSLAGFASVMLELGAGRIAHLSLGVKNGARRIEVVAERGSAVADWPSRVTWRDEEGRHALHLPGGLGERRLLERFAAAVRAGQAVEAEVEREHAALTWVRAARASLAEGRPIVFEGNAN